MSDAKSKESVRKRINRELSKAGLNEEYVEKNTFYEIEEDLGIPHFRYSNPKSGHILLSSYADKKIKKNLKSLLGEVD